MTINDLMTAALPPMTQWRGSAANDH